SQVCLRTLPPGQRRGLMWRLPLPPDLEKHVIQRVKRWFPKLLSEFAFCGSSMGTHDRIQPAAPRSQAHQSSTFVLGVGDRFEISVFFQVPQQIVDRLFGDLQALSQLARATPV